VNEGCVYKEEDLVRHLPTIPQLFVQLALTKFVINFFHFIAICALKSVTVEIKVGQFDLGDLVKDNAFSAVGEDWFQITSW
jgi:hypothetical protein